MFKLENITPAESIAVPLYLKWYSKTKTSRNKKSRKND